METKESVCKLAPHCKMAGNPAQCNQFCSPFIFLHGVEGVSGLWKASNVPYKYRNSTFDTLPIKEANPSAHAFLRAYKGNLLENVKNGVGLFLYSVPNPDNKLGTGTGKTTSATAIANEFILARVIEHTKGIRPIKTNPVLFYKASELQTLYNSQFRGTPEMQDEASRKYYKIKKLLMKVELLVLDDIGIRQKITDAFENELTEVIDARDNGADEHMLTTIYTSNLPVEKLAETMGERIASRIAGMTEAIPFKGKDHRRGGVLR